MLWKFYLRHSLVKIDNLTAIKPWVGRTSLHNSHALFLLSLVSSACRRSLGDILMSSSLCGTFCSLEQFSWGFLLLVTKVLQLHDTKSCCRYFPYCPEHVEAPPVPFSYRKFPFSIPLPNFFMFSLDSAIFRSNILVDFCIMNNNLRETVFSCDSH